jgi:integrase
MSRPNVHGLPRFLRKDAGGYFLDYFVQEGGIKKRKRVRLGLIPLAQAKRVLAQHMQDLVEQRFIAVEKPKVTFLEAADSFLAYSAVRKKSHKNDAQITARLKTFFKDRALESLTPDLVETYLVQRRKEGNKLLEGKTLKGATLNRDVACLKTIVRRAVLNRQIDRNPIEGVGRFKEYSRERTLTAEELQTLLGNCSPHLRSIVQLAYLSGMRRGEILGLTWDQVDFKNRIIVLEAENTKTQEKREIPMGDTLRELFQRIPRTLGSSFVFTFKGLRIGTIKTAFTRACERANITDFRFHDLRHCAITNLRKAGVSDSVIMSISGHKTYAVFRRYDRIDRKDRQEAIRKVESLIDTDMTLVENHPSQGVRP